MVFYPTLRFLPLLPHAAIFYPTPLPLLPLCFPPFTPPHTKGVLSIINVSSALASAALPVYNIPTSTPHRRLEPKKAPLRLTGAGESVTIKAQKEVLPIDGQSKV